MQRVTEKVWFDYRIPSLPQTILVAKRHRIVRRTPVNQLLVAVLQKLVSPRFFYFKTQRSFSFFDLFSEGDLLEEL